jgi:hypothetical protein
MIGIQRWWKRARRSSRSFAGITLLAVSRLVGELLENSSPLGLPGEAEVWVEAPKGTPIGKHVHIFR